MKLISKNMVTMLFVAFCSQCTLFAQPAKKWKTIFDGKSYNGWTIVDTPANVKIQDGAFVVHMTNNTYRHVFIRSNKKYRDFILELDVKRDTSFDSGIILRGMTAPDTSKVGLYGYTIKIDPSLTRRWTGGIFLDFGSSIKWLYPLEGDTRAQFAERVEEWNHYRVESIGDNIKVWINGTPVTNMTNSRYKEGYVALKIHYLNSKTGWNDQMSAAFKNIRIIRKNAFKYALAMDIPAKETD